MAKSKEGELLKLKTGIPGFDNLFSKGIPEGSSILVEGGPGSGKTIFCLHIANNFCKQGKKVLYMSFEEPERRLAEHMPLSVLIFAYSAIAQIFEQRPELLVISVLAGADAFIDFQDDKKCCKI